MKTKTVWVKVVMTQTAMIPVQVPIDINMVPAMQSAEQSIADRSPDKRMGPGSHPVTWYYNAMRID